MKGIVTKGFRAENSPCVVKIGAWLFVWLLPFILALYPVRLSCVNLSRMN